MYTEYCCSEYVTMWSSVVIILWKSFLKVAIGWHFLKIVNWWVLLPIVIIVKGMLNYMQCKIPRFFGPQSRWWIGILLCFNTCANIHVSRLSKGTNLNKELLHKESSWMKNVLIHLNILTNNVCKQHCILKVSEYIIYMILYDSIKYMYMYI